VIVDNRVMVASIFRSVAPADFPKARDVYLRLQAEYQVPFQVANDGDVTALAGAMSLDEGRVLGIAMGSSEAAGYVDAEGNITGWLNELAFAPIDYAPSAPQDEWSGDIGCGVQYLTQQAVFRLAAKAGIDLSKTDVAAEKLRTAQDALESGHPGAKEVWQSIGVAFGYAVAHYAHFYDIGRILTLGRVTSGRGGPIIIGEAERVLRTEFPELAGIRLSLPDEKTRRVGQAVAAASLPSL
jgi:predicted NBD/HSP70 family sugar kinase